MEEIITLISLALASSAMDFILSNIIFGVEGPVFPAISLVPAKITTTLGFRSITSCLKRNNIWGVVCPLIPLLI